MFDQPGLVIRTVGLIRAGFWAIWLVRITQTPLYKLIYNLDKQRQSTKQVLNFQCVCDGKECDWKSEDHLDQHKTYTLGSCLFGCNAHVAENKSGKVFTNNNGKEIEEDWMRAKYAIRCPGSIGFENWYVLTLYGY